MSPMNKAVVNNLAVRDPVCGQGGLNCPEANWGLDWNTGDTRYDRQTFANMGSWQACAQAAVGAGYNFYTWNAGTGNCYAKAPNTGGIGYVLLPWRDGSDYFTWGPGDFAGNFDRYQFYGVSDFECASKAYISSESIAIYVPSTHSCYVKAPIFTGDRNAYSGIVFYKS
ncbi:hypothetical protein BC830DRAFT_724640 [Chytriomyces sp. MP71]|nr:hypothetical protein BC830DRAFT_724640 [Chytriomyces sp. MP71]